MAIVHAPTLFEEPGHAGAPRLSSGARRPVFVLFEGDQPRGVHALAEGDTTLGRDPACTLPTNDSRCSRRHAKVTVARGRNQWVVSVEDLGSTNGTHVNGERLGDRRQLREHDKVRIGSTTYAYALRDDAELEADRKLFQLATLDALTGLLNRGTFDGDFAREFERARGHGLALSVLLLDVDHFKRINDVCGHPVGDRALAVIGKVVRDSVRACDPVGRYGGEELAIVLTETGLDGATTAGERVRRAIEEVGFARESVGSPLTVSVGVATVWADCPGPEALLAAADRALYAAKAGGRNRVCVADPARAE